MPKIEENAIKNIPGAEERRITFILDTARVHGNSLLVG